MLDQLTESQRVSVERAAASGAYNLLLGAGMSFGTVDRSGRLLPTSSELAEELSTQFGVPYERGDLLWRVYDRAVGAARAEVVYEWLRSRFSGTTPPQWMEMYARFPWETVWTLNLDDAFENAYSSIAIDESRNLESVSWDDPYRHGRELSVIHLHGHVLHAEPRQLVFSISEYANAIVSRAAWPITFRDTYGIAPFVVIGARLRDEPDIEAVVAARRGNPGAIPSFYVSPRISNAVKLDLEQWGLVPIEMTAEEFIGEWAALTKIDLTAPPVRSEELSLRVGRQFRELRTDSTEKVPRNHDFLGGDAPRWSDIVHDRFARFGWISQAEQTALRSGQTAGGKGRITVVVGKRLSGRTTGLLAVGRALRRASWRTFIFVGDERPDVDAIIGFCADGKSVALLFDGVADVADDVAEVLARASSAGLNLMCVAVDNEWRSPNLVGRIPASRISDGVIRSIRHELSKSDAGVLVDFLNSQGRLGVLESERNDWKRLNHFVGKGLFSSLSEISDAPGFGRRISEIVDSVGDDELKLLFFASLSNFAERRLLLIDAARLLGVGSERIPRMLEGGAIRALAGASGDGVVTHQRWLALKPTIEKLGTADALDLVANGLSRLSARLGRQAQRERNATALLVGSLMSYRLLAEVFPHQNYESWYANLVSSFGDWSGRYWEQRAIANRHAAESDPNALSRAESFARRAVAFVPDTYAYTTLATVLAARSSRAVGNGMVDYYDQMWDSFEKAAQFDSANLVTWLAYLRHSLPILDSLNVQSFDGADAFCDRLLADWRGVCESLAGAAAQSQETEKVLRELNAKFEKLSGAARRQ